VQMSIGTLCTVMLAGRPQKKCRKQRVCFVRPASSARPRNWCTASELSELESEMRLNRAFGEGNAGQRREWACRNI